MKINKSIFIVIIAMIFLVISSVNAQDETDNDSVDLAFDGNVSLSSSGNSIYVDDLAGDDRNDGKSWDSSVKTINQALNLSSDGATIHLSSGNYNSTGNVRINITKSVNIVGSENTTFNGLGKDYLFVVNDNLTVTFKNINFVNALKNQNSYPLHDSEGEWNLNNRYGAALEIKNSTVTIDNCQFSNNKLSNGLKKYAIYGAAVSSFGDLTILNSYFSNNLIDSMAPSRYGYGGAVFNRGKLYVNNSSFVNSKGGKTGTYGAAIANYGFAKMENSIIDNSTALTQSYGSAIYNKGTFILSNSIIKNNRIGYGDGGYKYYGAVYNLGDFTGIGSIFENNTFTRSSSLQSAWYTANIYNEGTLNLTYNAFINNQMYSDSSDVSTSNFRRDVYNNGDVTSLNNNWWGSNENPNAMRFTNVEGISTWLTFTLNPDYSALDIGGKITIQAELKPNEGSAKLNSFPVFSTTFKTSSVNSTKKLVNGKAKFVFDDTKNKGAYEVIAVLTGFEQKIFIDVGKLKSNIEFNVTKDLTYQDIFQINVTVKGKGAKNPTGHVLMSLNGVEYTINLKNGAGTYKIDRLSKGEYSLKLTYMGDDDYAKSFTNGTVKVKRLPVDLKIDIPNVKVGQLVENGQIILNTSDAQGTYKLYIDGVYKASGRIYPGNTPIKNLGQYPEGKHEVILVYEGSDNFEPVNLTTSFEVSRYSTILNVYANNINAGEDAVITIEAIPETLRGDAELYINDVKQLIFLEDTFTNVTIYNLEPGRYDVSVVYLGDNQYYSSNDTTSFRVVKQTSNLTVNITQKENEYTGKIVVKTIPSKCTGLIGVYVNFREYKLNLTKGVARFNVEFDKGTNYIFVYYEGDDYYEGCEWNTTVGIVDTYEIIGSNVTAYEHNDFNYSIRLVEDSGVPIQYETVSVNVDGKFYNVTTNKFGFGYLTLNLAKGTYNVVSTYREESITNTFTINEIKFNLTTENFDYGGSGIIKAEFNDDVEGSVRFYIKDVVDEIVPIANGIALINISGVNASTYKVYVNYKNDVYSSAKVSKTFKVNKLDLDFTYSFNQHDYVLSVGSLDNATGSLSIQIDSKKYNSAINNSKTELKLKTLSKGNHSLVITYKGDRNYNAFTLNSYIFVKELTTDITLKIKNGVYGKDLTVTANINKNASGVIRFDVEDLSKEVTVKNGVAKWVFGGIGAGTHNITANYLGDDYYIDVSNSTTFKVSKSSSKIVLYVKDVYLDENIIIYTNLSTNATGKVLYSMDNYYSPRYKPTTDSKSVWYISPLDTGSYTIRATFEGDNNYYESSTVFILNISQKRAILDVEIEDVNVKDRVVSNFKLTNSKGVGLSGKVKLELNSRTYDIDVKKGESSLVIGKLPAGNYSYTVSYAGNSIYGKTSYKGSFEVRETRLNTTIYAYNLTKYYKNAKKLSIYLVSSKNKVISGATMDVTIAGKTYTVVTNDEGLATLDVNLATGSYVSSIYFEGDDDYFASSANATVTILSTVEGIDVVKVYGTSTQYYAVFSDSNGKPLANKQVKFTIGSNSYKATTLPNGIVRLNINLKAGTYTITAINPVTSQKYSNKIVIKNRLMENKNIQKYYGGTKKYQVRAYGDNGKVAVGVNVKMKLNGKTYTVKTDKKGYARLSVNLKPGTYTVKATYKGYSVSNKITVKSTIVTKNLSKKKSKTASFQAKLLNSNGKILKGKKITFKFKGKKYTAKTSSKGIATFKVKNNLKVGKYKIYTTYGKLTRTNTITVKK